MNVVTVLFFATLKDRTGTRVITLEVPEGTQVSSLKELIVERYPALNSAMRSTLISVNHEYAADDDFIPDHAEIAMFPPVSGGELPGQQPGDPASPALPTYIGIIEGELDLNALLEKITLPTTGAACFFTGLVRGKTRRDDPHETSYLDYEAYQPMAEAKMRQVVEEIRSRWSTVEGIVIVQRIGRLYPGTPTVLIGCTAAHRDTGVFEAARYGVDRLKEIVPIWKKEVGPYGETWVEGDYFPTAGE
jgi:molybdopterin synthase catalytic subunit